MTFIRETAEDIAQAARTAQQARDLPPMPIPEEQIVEGVRSAYNPPPRPTSEPTYASPEQLGGRVFYQDGTVGSMRPTDERVVNLVSDLQAQQLGQLRRPDYNRWQREIANAALLAQYYGWDEHSAWVLGEMLGSLADEYPAIWRNFATDLEKTVRLTEPELFAQLKAGEIDFSSDLSRELLQATDQVWATWAGSAMDSYYEKQGTILLEGMWDAGDYAFQPTIARTELNADPRLLAIQQEISQYEGLQGYTTSPVAWAGTLGVNRNLGWYGPDYTEPWTPAADPEKPVRSWSQISDRPAHWFVTEDGHLVININYKTGGEHEAQASMVLRLAEGDSVTSGPEAVLAVLQALNGTRHQLLHTDEIPGLQTGFGRAFEFVGDIIRGYEATPLSSIQNLFTGLFMKYLIHAGDPNYEIVMAPSSMIAAAEAREQSRLQAEEYAAGAVGLDEAVIAHMGLLGAIEPSLRQRPDETLQAMSRAFTALPESDQDQFISEMRELTAEQVQPYYYSMLENQPRFSEELGKAGGFLLDAFTAYDQAIHGMAINLFHLPGAIGAAISGDVEGTKYDDPWEAFRASYESIDATYLSEYWGLDGATAFWTDLGASIFLDPITWFTPGATGLWHWSKAVLSEPSLAGQTLRYFPTLRRAARHMLDNNNVAEAILFSRGMTTEGILRTIDLAANPMMRWNQQGIGEFVQVITAEMRNGGWIPFSTTRANPTRTALGVSQWFKGYPHASGADRNRMMNAFLNLSQQRGISIVPEDFLDGVAEFVVYRLANDPARGAAVMRQAVDAYRLSKSGGTASAVAAQGQYRHILRALRAQNRQLYNRAPVTVRNYEGIAKSVRSARDLRYRMATELSRYDAGLPSPARPRGTRAQAQWKAQQPFFIADDVQANAVRQTITQLDSVITHYSDDLARHTDAEAAYRQARNQTRGQIISVKRAMNNLDEPDNIQPLLDWMVEFMDDWAVEVLGRKGITDPARIWTRKPNTLHSNPSRRQIDWLLITDPEQRFRQTRIVGKEQENIEFWAPFYTNPDGEIDQTLRRILTRADFNLEMTDMPLPVSPWELVAFDNMPSMDAWYSFIYNPKLMAGRRVLETALTRIQSAFAFSVLINLITPFRTGLDEPLRFLAETGDWRRFLKAVGASVPGVSTSIKPERWVGAHPLTNAFRRTSNNVLLYRNPQWRWIERGAKEHPAAVERFLNGQGSHIEALRIWARAQLDGQFVFADWYQGDWLLRTRDRSVRVVGTGGTGRKVPTAQEAHDTITNGLELWLSQISDVGIRDQLRTAIIRAWAEGKRIDEVLSGGSNAAYRLYRQAGRVPGEVFVGGRGIGGGGKASKAAAGFGDFVDSAWKHLYAGPQEIRQTIFYEHYREWVDEVLAARFRGRVVTANWIQQNFPTITPAEANRLVSSPTAQLRQMARQLNMVWPRQLEMWGHRFARSHAEDLMYMFVSSSLSGHFMRRFYNPFTRAGIDFVRWWGKKLTEPFSVGLSPMAKGAVQAASELTHPLRLFSDPGQALRRVGQASTDYTQALAYSQAGHPVRAALRGAATFPVSARGEPLPFNVRLWSRFAHMFAAFDREREAAGERAEELGRSAESGRWQAGREHIPGLNLPYTPLGIGRAFSFFPDDLNGTEMLISLVPQPGYFPLSALLLSAELLDMAGVDIDADHPLRKALADVFPVLRFYDSTYLGETSGMTDLALPVLGGRTFRGLTDALNRLINRQAGTDQGTFLNSLNWILGSDGLPPGAITYASNNWGEVLEERAFSPGWTFRSPDWMAAAEQAYADGVAEANVNLGSQRAPRVVSATLNSRIGVESGYLQHYQVIIDNLDALVDGQLITARRRDQIKELYRRFIDPTFIEEERLGIGGIVSQRQPGPLTEAEIDTLSSYLTDIYYGPSIPVTLDSERAAQFDEAYARLSNLPRRRRVQEAGIAAGIPALMLADLSPDAQEALIEYHIFSVGLPDWVRDEWLVFHPGLAVNVVSKMRAQMRGGEPIVPDKYARFFYPDGRLDNTTLNGLGWQEATRLREEMLARGVLVDREPYNIANDGWMEDAQGVVFGAARRSVYRAWTYLTAAVDPNRKGERWNQHQDRYLTSVFRREQMPPHTLALLEALGYDFPEEITGLDLREDLRRLASETFYVPSGRDTTATVDGIIAQHTQPADGPLIGIIQETMRQAGITPLPLVDGAQLLELKDRISSLTEEAYGVDSPWDWPDESREMIRERVYQRAVDLGWITPEQYRQSGLNRLYGPLGMTPPQIRSEADLLPLPPADSVIFPGTVSLSPMIFPDRATIANRIEVVDGDTLNVYMDNFVQPIRLQGINAPDRGQVGYRESTLNLQQLIGGAERVVLGFYRPDIYGTYQVADPSTGAVRLKMFLIVDGVPIVDENVYTTSAPTGISSGLPFYVPPILDIYTRGREAQEGD